MENRVKDSAKESVGCQQTERTRNVCGMESLLEPGTFCLPAPCTGREHIHVALGHPAHGYCQDNLGNEHCQHPQALFGHF